MAKAKAVVKVCQTFCSFSCHDSQSTTVSLSVHEPTTSLIEQLTSLGPQKTADFTVPPVASKSNVQNQSPPSQSSIPSTSGVRNIDTKFIYVDASCKSLQVFILNNWQHLFFFKF